MTLRPTTITGDLTGGRFTAPTSRVFLEGVEFQNVDLTELTFSTFSSTGSLLEACRFDGSRIHYGPLSIRSPTIFRQCSFDRCELGGVDPGTARFEQCSFRQTKITHWLAFCAEFVECVFETTIERSKFSGTPFQCEKEIRRSKNEFDGNDFRKACFVDTEFVMGIDLARQMLPESNEYVRLDQIGMRLDGARGQIAHWLDLKKRREALSMIDALEAGADGQDELFMRREDLGGDASVRRLVWELLEDRA